ncbi:hypothetical protein CR159_21345, partial [Pollutimonas subterranea]
ITQLAKFDVLIIDELGYLPMTAQARFNLFQLVNVLYEYRSIIPVFVNNDVRFFMQRASWFPVVLY